MGDKKYEAVISGISGRFPGCDSVEELKLKLFNKVNMVTVDNRKWLAGELDVPPQLGKMKDIFYFDTTFFGIHTKLCKSLDSLTRQNMERTFEAIFDAGVNPVELHGTNTAVFMASMTSESEFITLFDHKKESFGILGHNRTMQANRISYNLHLTGPSFSMDSTWTGGMQALQLAQRMIEEGRTNAALVGTCSLLQHSNVSLQYFGMGKLNNDGCTKSFSADADGYSRAEACVVFFLQRAEDARRSYGTLLHTKTLNFGERQAGFVECWSPAVHKLLDDAYRESGVNPCRLAYLEADGSASKKADATELNAVADVLCCNRSDPLLIGSVKSNLGHTEATASMVAMVKALITLDSGVIPPNLHYSQPNPDVPALVSGQIQVVTEPTPLPGDTVGVTTLGLAGTYGHVIMSQNKKIKKKLNKDDVDASMNDFPILITASGRNDAGMKIMLYKIENVPIDREFISLLHHVFRKDIQGHLFRGFTILPHIDVSDRKVQQVTGEKRPVWFVFSGMGSQWAGMGKHLLQIPIFAAAIDKCQTALASAGIDVRHIITNPDPKSFDNILNSFIGIAAIQIGLVDILFALGIKPDGIVGHSVGELGCAYADGCFTAEQMILAAYARGRASIETKLIRGKMAAVGKGYKEIKDQLPESIEVACHNSADSCTLSGPDEDMEKYITELQKRGVFAKLVNVSNIAYHSRYIAPAAPALLRYLKEVIPEPKPRSSRWVSSSIPEKDGKTPLAATSSAEYHTNNLLSSVLFEEATAKIPHNAITIEIAPHGLLQAILRRSLTAGCTNVPLTQRDNKHGLRYLLAAIGKLYLAGVTPDLTKLYPPVEFPVSRGTSALHPLIVWEHSEEWSVAKLTSVLGDNLGERVLSISLTDDNYQIYKFHKLYGRVVLPPAALLVFAWESLSNLRKETGFKVPVVFEDVQFLSSVEIPDKSKVKLYMLLRRGTGEWEMCVDQTVVATGRINACTEDMNREYVLEILPKHDDDTDVGVEYTDQDVYTFLDSFGYTHGDMFKGIRSLSANDNRVTAKVQWQGNWMLCLDSLLKVALFSRMDSDSELYIPTKIRRLFINPNKIVSNKNVAEVDVTYDNATGMLSSTTLGLVMTNVSCHTPTIEPFHTLALQIYERRFMSYRDQTVKDESQMLNICIQLVLENLLLAKDGQTHMTVAELQNSNDPSVLLPQVESILDQHPYIKPEILFGTVDTIYSKPEEDPAIAKETKENYLAIATHHNSIRDALTLNENHPRAFLLLNVMANCAIPADLNLTVIVEQHFGNTKTVLLKRSADIHAKTNYVVHTETKKWMEVLAENIKALEIVKSYGDGVVYLVTKGEPFDGVRTFVRNTELAFGCPFIRYVFILDDKVPEFSLTSPFYAKHLAQDLKVNIVKDSTWGSYRYFLVTDHITPVQEQKTTQLSKFSLGDINVKYLGLNICGLNTDTEVDVDDKCKLSHVEYSGVAKTGDRVMGLVEYQPAYDVVTPDSVFMWTVPRNWTLDTAATVPLSYILAYNGLVLKAQLEKCESVLIIGGQSTVGQAAIAVALSVGCTVYTSYAKKEQQQFLLKQFPQLHESRIFCSENIAFEQEMLLHTKGKGFKVIFNCLGENKFRATVKCLQRFGRYLQLGYLDKDNCGKLGSTIFLESTSLFGCYAENLLTLPVDTKKQLKELVTKGIDDGTVKPFKSKVLSGSYSGVEALKLLCKEARGADDVKVLVSLDENKVDKISCELDSKKYICDPDKSYIVFGGSNGLWMEFTEWLVRRGARKVIIALNKLAMSSLTAQRLNVLMHNYASATIDVVSISHVDIDKAANSLLVRAIKLGTPAAVFFVTVDDSSNIVYSTDRVSRRLLDPVSVQFVCVLSGGVDICEQRRRDGLPALALLWDIPYFAPSKVLPALDNLLTEDSHKSPVVLLTEYNLIPPELDMSPIHLQWQLPEDLDQLIEFGEDAAAAGNKACFTEVATRSPRYKYTKDISPVFLIPSLKPGQFDGLLKRLVYPAFRASLPLNVESIQQAANLFLQVIKKDFNNLGMFTLVGSSWGGGVALTLAHLLEAEGKHTTVILFDGAPETVQTWTNSISSDLDFNILERYFTITNQIRTQLNTVGEWQDKLNLVTAGLDSADKIKIGLTTLRNRMQAIMNLTPPTVEDKVNGQTYLYRPQGAHESDDCSLQEYCKKNVIIYLSKESDFQRMLDTELTSRYVNSLNMFEYPDAVFVHDTIRPYETSINTFVDDVIF